MKQKEEWQNITIPIKVAVKFVYEDDGKEGGCIKIDYNEELIKKSIGDFFISSLNEACMGTSETSNEIFMPHRKHEDSDRRVQNYIDGLKKTLKDDEESPILEIISLLEDRFFNILFENGIMLDLKLR